MVTSFRVSTQMMSSTDGEHFCGKMARSTKESLKMI